MDDLNEMGHKLVFNNVMDNQVPDAIKYSSMLTHVPGNLWIPTTTKLMQQNRQSKHSKTSGLCTTDQDFPFKIWDQLAKQAKITCTLIQSRINPSLSTYHELYDGMQCNWIAHPLAPPGT
jgi:hypothetical protein